MKRAILIGKFDETAREIGNSLSSDFQVLPCCEEQDLIKEMLKTEIPDLIIVYLTGSAVAARDMFTFLLPYKYPLLGIGSEDNQAELFINGYLSAPDTRFLNKPAAPADIIRCAKKLCGIEDAEKPQADDRQAGNQQGEAAQSGGQQDTAGMGQENEEQEETKILLVDDSPGFVRAMQAILSQRYKVIFATSAVQCIIAVAKHKPDLILLDYEMPVCDGKKTLQMLRSEKDMKDIPVVFLTGKSDAKRVSDVMSLRPQGYLLKPCSEEMVFSTIEQALKRKGGK